MNMMYFHVQSFLLSKCVLPCFSTFLLALYINAFLGYCEVCFLLMRSSLPPFQLQTPLCVLYVVKKIVDYCDIAKLVLNIYTSVFFMFFQINDKKKGEKKSLKKKTKKKKTKTKFKSIENVGSIVDHRHISVPTHTCAH